MSTLLKNRNRISCKYWVASNSLIYFCLHNLTVDYFLQIYLSYFSGNNAFKFFLKLHFMLAFIFTKNRKQTGKPKKLLNNYNCNKVLNIILNNNISYFKIIATCILLFFCLCSKTGITFLAVSLFFTLFFFCLHVCMHMWILLFCQ